MERGDVELGNTYVTRKCLQSLLNRVEKEVKSTYKSSPSICMVSNTLRDLSPGSFNPQVVSIGPLHRKNKNVQAFEGRKVSYLIKLLRRINVPKEEILESCVQKVYASMEKIRACYVCTKKYNDAEIVEMIVIDACFILEFLCCDDNGSASENILQGQLVRCDLMLLENQIPCFILNEIFECTLKKSNSSLSLIGLLRPVLSYHNIFDEPIRTGNISVDKTPHILSLLRECYKPKQNKKLEDLGNVIIPSIVDLDRAGVSFKPNKNPTWPMQMKVDSYGLDLYGLIPWFFRSWTKPTLRMPVLKIHDSTETILRNLIAYELLCETDNHIISYVAAIDMLVDTQEDVAKLIDSEVLINIMGSTQQATNMINNICKEVVWTSFNYKEEWKTLNDYCNVYWSKQIVKLRRTYFSSPWSFIALLAGIILFVLTLIQTVFTVKPVGSN